METMLYSLLNTNRFIIANHCEKEKSGIIAELETAPGRFEKTARFSSAEKIRLLHDASQIMQDGAWSTIPCSIWLILDFDI